jgi:hypothetical protein
MLINAIQIYDNHGLEAVEKCLETLNAFQKDALAKELDYALLVQASKYKAIEQILFRQDRPKCDTCGKPATNGAQNIIEVFSDQPFRKFRTLGKIKFGCDDHRVGSHTFHVGDPGYAAQLGQCEDEI